MTKIAFIGTGIMGAGMAQNLLNTGYDVTVYNRTASKTGPLVEAGATRADTPGEAVDEADAIISIVGNDDSSRAVWLGSDGILAGNYKPGAIAVESTTLSLAWVQELDGILKEKGLRFIDSPVTGGRGGAENGTLTLLVGAEEENLAAARHILAAFSENIIHFGPPPGGTAYKLIVNLMTAVQAVALAEGIALAEQAGLDMERVIEGLTTGAVASPLVKGHTRRMIESDHDFVNFSTRWMHKDAVYAIRMAADMAQAMPLSALAPQIFQTAVNDDDLADKNFSSVVEVVR